MVGCFKPDRHCFCGSCLCLVIISGSVLLLGGFIYVGPNYSYDTIPCKVTDCVISNYTCRMYPDYIHQSCYMAKISLIGYYVKSSPTGWVDIYFSNLTEATNYCEINYHINSSISCYYYYHIGFISNSKSLLLLEPLDVNPTGFIIFFVTTILICLISCCCCIFSILVKYSCRIEVSFIECCIGSSPNRNQLTSEQQIESIPGEQENEVDEIEDVTIKYVYLKTDEKCLVGFTRVPKNGKYKMCSCKSEHIVQWKYAKTLDKCPYCSHPFDEPIYRNGDQPEDV